MSQTVLIYSGGLDSTTLLYWLLNRGDEIKTLCFDYGQRHVREKHAARSICEKLSVPYQCVCLGLSSLLKSSLTQPEIEVPEGHYEEESMKATVVPNRNMIMLSIAVGYCISEEFEAVAYAAHSGDHAIYPDCRREFVEAMRKVVELCDWADVGIEVPFLSLTKAQIVSTGSKLNVPFGETWTCYKGLQKHCGKCGSCVERKEAFELADVPDPTEYEGR